MGFAVINRNIQRQLYSSSFLKLFGVFFIVLHTSYNITTCCWIVITALENSIVSIVLCVQLERKRYFELFHSRYYSLFVAILFEAD